MDKIWPTIILQLWFYAQSLNHYEIKFQFQAANPREGGGGDEPRTFQ